MDHIKEQIQPLYDSRELLGFSIFEKSGNMLINESFLDDRLAWKATKQFIMVHGGMLKATRKVQRLTVKLDDVILIYRSIEKGHALFSLSPSCDLNHAVEILP